MFPVLIFQSNELKFQLGLWVLACLPRNGVETLISDLTNGKIKVVWKRVLICSGSSDGLSSVAGEGSLCAVPFNECYLNAFEHM